MLIVWVCASIPAVTIAWFLVPVGYTASVDIRFMATAPYVLKQNGYRDPYEKFLSTQISLITGSTVLSRVLDSPDIRDIPTLVASRDPLAYLQGQVDARVQRTSELVTITCSMPNREDAQRILEEVVAVYMKYTSSEEASAGNERLATLTKERDARQLELDAELKRLANYRRRLVFQSLGRHPWRRVRERCTTRALPGQKKSS